MACSRNWGRRSPYARPLTVEPQDLLLTTCSPRSKETALFWILGFGDLGSHTQQDPYTVGSDSTFLSWLRVLNPCAASWYVLSMFCCNDAGLGKEEDYQKETQSRTPPEP